MLGWTQTELAERSLVSKRTIARFELEERFPADRTKLDLKRTFEEYGISFLDADENGPGLRYSRDLASDG
jgi:transcriptional regulator with XRE-family HTH domain